MIGLHPRLAGLEILSGNRNAAILRQLEQRRSVDAEIRRAIAERHALHDRGVRVEHRRRDRFVVLLHRLLELLDRRVLRAGLDEDLGRRAPDDHDAVALVLRLEVANVLPQLLGEIALGLSLLDVGAVNARDVLVVEHRRHRLDRSSGNRRSARCPSPRARRLSSRRCSASSGIGSHAPNTMSSSVGERNEILDQRRALLGSLSEPDRRHLRQRADRLGIAAPNALDSRHECRRDCAESRCENAEPAGGRRY